MSASFFAPYRQEPVSIRGVPGKSPMFFRSLKMMGGIFLADRARAQAALPGGLRALRLPPGRTAVAVHCMEYADSDIGPYNEVALSIAVRRGWLPFLSLARAARALAAQSFDAYVKALPVTTEVALHGGIDFFNYPKYLADIAFRETPSHRVCTLRDKRSGELILEFVGRKLAARGGAGALTLRTYPEIGGRPRLARLLIDRLEGGTCWLRGAGLRLGSHARAEDFRSLGLGRLLQYAYVPRAQGVLFAPEP